MIDLTDFMAGVGIGVLATLGAIAVLANIIGPSAGDVRTLEYIQTVCEHNDGLKYFTYNTVVCTNGAKFENDALLTSEKVTK